MAKIVNKLTELIGNTPLLALNKFLQKEDSIRLFLQRLSISSWW